MPSKLAGLADSLDPATLKLVLILLGLIIGIASAAVLPVFYLE